MKTRPPELNIVKGGQGFVRAHPEVFFPRGVTGHELVGALVQEAVVLGAKDVGAVVLLDWHVVGADLDWFATGRILSDDDDLFDRILALPELGANEMRAEVLVGALAADAITLTSDESRVVCGMCDVLQELRKLLHDRRWQRMVAFRLPTGAEQLDQPERAQ
jgi:hypothetical protein